jgi:PAS domain S-box-containing protein
MSESAVESSAEVLVDLNEKRPIRVLHVDDDSGFLKTAKPILEMQGAFQVDAVSSVEEAVEKMKKEEYDAIVSDYQMPGKDGLAFLKELRDRKNGVPFIMFTGKGREEVAIKALSLGADQYLNKVGDAETVYGELAHSIRLSVAKKEAEEHLLYQAQLMQNVSDAIIASDENFILTSWNQAAERMYGWKANEVIGRLGQDVLQSEFVGIDGAQAIQMLRETGKFLGEAIQLHRNGHRINVETSTMVLRGENNQTIGYVSVNRDITDRKKAEEAAKESEEKWHSLVEMAPDGMATVDTKGVFTSVNTAFLRLTGYKKEDIVGKHFTKLQTVQPKDIPKYLKLMISALRGKLPEPFEYSYVRKNGAISWGEAHIGSLKKNGKTIGYQVIFREITERKRIETKLLESEERFRLLFENAPVGVSLMDADGHVVAANEADCRFLRYTQKELVGMHFSKFTHPEDLKKDLELHKKLMEGKRNTYTIEKRYVRKDGKVVWGRLTASSIRDDSERLKYTVVICEGMPEERNAEKTFAELKMR